MTAKWQAKLFHFGEFLNEWYWNEEMNMTEIAKMCGCEPTTVRHHFLKNNIPRRTGVKENHITIEGELKEILVGELLGDGSLKLGEGAKGAIYTHANKHYDYLQWLFNKLSCLGLEGNGKKYHRTTKWESTGNESSSYASQTFRYRELTDLRNEWYPEGKKIVPENIKLTPTIALHWFLGDGCYTKRTDRRNLYRIYLSTDCFTYEEVEFLREMLREIGITAYTQEKRKGSNQYRIHIYEKASIQQFFNFIGSCPEGIKQIYRYKFPIEEQRALTYSEEEIRNRILKNE